MAASHKLKTSFPRLKSFLQLQRFKCTFVEEGVEAELFAELGPKKMAAPRHVDPSTWKKLDSRTLGLTASMISDSSRIVLRILQNEGHDAYLVGGCVRDLLLNKIPKDFDVITTANLQEIKRKFHRAFIVGRRFPICMVHVRGSAIEVSSFETVARDAKEKEHVHLSETPKGCDEKDLMRWNNSLHRDFTINSLFYDPFANKIYDYSSGMADLMSMKLRTLVPAHVSFEEDCARILRGMRIAARLQLSFAKETEKAIYNLYGSIKTLDKARLMMEMNYMLSYGAAVSSLLLLKRFNLLEVLLPFHAAYLATQSGSKDPIMLMKLFFNLDNVVSCDQPCDSGLWVSLLAFHLALVNNPQDAIVVWTLSSVLYHGKWKEGVKAARELVAQRVNFVPEILASSNDMTDEELAQKVAGFTSTVLDSIDALTDSRSLKKAMGHYPSAPHSGSVFISKNAGKEAADIFFILVNDIESLRNGRQYYNIDYRLLGKGDIEETRFVLGKVIIDTMKGGVTQCRTKLETEKKDYFCAPNLKTEQVEVEKPTSTVSELEAPKSKDRVKRGLNVTDDQPDQQKPKKQKQNNITKSALERKRAKEKLVEILSCQDIEKKNQLLKKVVVKDVKKLLSLQQQVTKKDAKLALGKHCDSHASEGLLALLEAGPKMVKTQEVQAPEEKVSVAEKTSKTPRQRKAQASKKKSNAVEKTSKIKEQHKAEDQTSKKILSAPERTSDMKQQHKTEASTEMLNVLKLSSHSKGEKELVKKPVKPEQQTVGDEFQQRTTRSLSSLFK